MSANIKRKPFWEKFADRDFAYSYAQRLVKGKLANQFRHLRGDLSQAEFAKALGTRQSKISERFENPEYGKHSLKTLFDAAKKVGLMLDVELKAADTFYRDNHDFSRDWFYLPDFKEAVKRLSESKSGYATLGEAPTKKTVRAVIEDIYENDSQGEINAPPTERREVLEDVG